MTTKHQQRTTKVEPALDNFRVGFNNNAPTTCNEIQVKRVEHPVRESLTEHNIIVYPLFLNSYPSCNSVKILAMSLRQRVNSCG